MRKSKEELAKGCKITLWQSSIVEAVQGLNNTQKGALLDCIVNYLCGSPYSSSNEVIAQHFSLLLNDFDAEKNKAEENSKKRSIAGSFSHKGKSNVPNGTTSENVPNGTGRMYQMVQKSVPNGTTNVACRYTESLFPEEQTSMQDVPNGTEVDYNNIYINNLNNNNITRSKKDKKEINKERTESEIDPNVPNGTRMADIPIGGSGMVNGKKVFKRANGLVFIAPTEEEVEAYIKEKGFHFNAKVFISYYEPEDWHYGEKRTPVKSWKRCCSTFEDNYIRREGRIALAKQTPRVINAHENINNKTYEQF